MKNDLIAITLARIWLSGYGTLLEVTDKIKAMHRLVSFGVKFEFFDQHPRSLHILRHGPGRKAEYTFISVVFSSPMIHYPFRSFSCKQP